MLCNKNRVRYYVALGYSVKVTQRFFELATNSFDPNDGFVENFCSFAKSKGHKFLHFQFFFLPFVPTTAWASFGFCDQSET